MDAVSLFVRNNQYETAISTARALDVDMTGIFQSLTTKCVGLARSAAMTRNRAQVADIDAPDVAFLLASERSATWQGPTVDRAWRFLQIHIEQQDGPDTRWRYRQAVLERILSLDKRSPLPRWLLVWFQVSSVFTHLCREGQAS